MKLLLVEPQALYREGLALLITQGFPELELLQAGDFAEALAQLERHGDVDLMLLDLELPDAEAARGMLEFRARFPGLAVILLSGSAAAETLPECLRAAAAGFIAKTAPADFMQAALRGILDRRAAVAGTPAAATRRAALPESALPELALSTRSGPAAALPESDAAPGPSEGLTDLTPRQRDVLRLLIEGKTNKLICRELSLSESTVKTHLASIFRRLGATSRTQAVVAAARMGLELGPAVSAGS